MVTIYQAHWHDPDDGRQLSWHASRLAAERAVKEAVRLIRDRVGLVENGEPCGVKVCAIPTTKAGLIGWLNAWVRTDN